jgi:hypothetical protein
MLPRIQLLQNDMSIIRRKHDFSGVDIYDDIPPQMKKTLNVKQFFFLDMGFYDKIR